MYRPAIVPFARCPAPCPCYDLGRLAYQSAQQLQRRLVAARLAGGEPDRLLLLEHPPVITIGQGGTAQHVLVSPERLATEGIALFYTDRGGEVTYHGPGQLVGYPVIHLRERGLDLHQYVRCLEEVMLGTLTDLAVTARRRPGHPGAWLGEQKIGALGIRVTRWVSSHGFALNVSGGLAPFGYIRPCGHDPGAVTSVLAVTGRLIPMDTVKHLVRRHFSEIFGVELKPAPAGGLLAGDER